ncbi:MAG: membrane protein insertase YidC [Corynebacterium sp.]|uniref:membrane protein insertase YidC n=1 Tax=Corynebacterium sp. TaxID=1720 RepID=UPI003F9B08EE
MLDFIYYPISAVLWFWHKVFGFVLGPDSGLSWALSIVFLVVTIRILFVRSTIKQLRSSRKMQEMQPRMQALRKKYANDQQTQALEMRKLQKEMGVNPLASCLPMLIQIPVFIGLFHVLRSFNRTGDSMGMLGMSIEETRNTSNYVFGVDEVQSFLDARLFGTPLSGTISMPEESFAAFAADGSVDFARWNIVIVVLPLMLIASVLMHFNARMSMDRQKRRQAAQPKKKNATAQEDMMQNQMMMMQKLMLWVMPVMMFAGGFLWQVGLAVYMCANTSWMFVQQLLVFRKMDREEEEEKEAKLAAKRTSAPKPGKRPKGGAAVESAPVGDTDVVVDEVPEEESSDVAPAASSGTAAESSPSASGSKLDSEQAEKYRRQAASMTPDALDSAIVRMEEIIENPPSKNQRKKRSRNMEFLSILKDQKAGREG